MSSSRDFAAAVKSGKRVGRRSLVVHLGSSRTQSPVSDFESVPGIVVSGDGSTSWDPVTPPARLGLIVSKAVGDSVTRHSVSRRLRAAAREVIDELADGDLVVVRALRSATDDDANELARQLRSGLRKLEAL